MKRIALGSLLSCMLVGQIFTMSESINFLTGTVVVAGPSITFGCFLANDPDKGKFGLTRTYAKGVLMGGLASGAVGGLIAYNMRDGAFKSGLVTGAAISGASCLLPAVWDLLWCAAH